MRLVIEANEIPIDKQAIKATASFGVAAMNSSARGDIETLLEHADKAPYEAKAGGRNRVVAWRCSPSDGAAERRRVLKAGQILFNGRSSTMDCTVRWLSKGGAGLDVSVAAGFPKLFYLLIRSEGFEKPCRVVSHRERQVEVAFC